MSKWKWVKHAAITTALRRVFRTSPAFRECLSDGREEYFIQAKNGNQVRRVHFKCDLCGTLYPKLRRSKKGQPKEEGIAVDHIEPVVDPLDGNKLPSGETDWNKTIDRMIVDRSKLQRLCRSCHRNKSNEENAVRREVRKKKNS